MTSMLKDVESYKKLLKDMKSTSGDDLYTHLVEVFGILMRHYPEEPLDKIEEVSYLCKNKNSNKKGDSNLKMEEFLKLNEDTRHKLVTEALQLYAERAGKLFEKPQLEEDEEPPEKAPVGNVPDLAKLGRMFEWAGINFGEKEYFLLQKSIAKLAEKTGASNLKFWGKIYGTQRDYYIAQGKLEGGDEDEGEGEEKPADFEPRDQTEGVNAYVYWVTHDAMSEWKQLPDLLPRELISSRLIKVTLTGDLEKKIITNPFFNGKEKHYLRAQIARIHHGTTLVPKGLYRTQEEEPREIEADEPEDEENKYVPQTENQQSLSNWCHLPKSILNNARTSHMEPEVPEDEEIEPEELLKQIEAKDPYETRLKPIEKDQDVEKGVPAWIIRTHGDNERQPTLTGQSQHSGIVVVKSLRWPGSITLWKGQNWHQIYVGNGHKYEAKSYFPVVPPTVPEDPEDLEEQPEPNPSEEPPKEPKEGEGEGDKEGEGEGQADE